MGLTVSACQNLFGSLSISCCSAVVASFILFPEIRKLRYIELATYVAVCDIWSALGDQETGTFGCGFQSVVNSVFTLAGLFWSVVILYQVWLITLYGKILQDLTVFHFVCWGLPVVVTLLPLFDLKYGDSDDSEHWCYLMGGNVGQRIGWMIGSFFVWCWIAILLNVYFLAAIIIKLKQMAVVPTVLNTTLLRLIGYPAIYTIAWLPMTAVELTQVSGYGTRVLNSTSTEVAVTALAISPGFFQALVYFYINKNVRLKWYYLLYPKPSEGDDMGLSIKDVENAQLAKTFTNSSGSTGVGRNTEATDEAQEFDYIGEPASRQASRSDEFCLHKEESSGFGTGFLSQQFSSTPQGVGDADDGNMNDL